MDYDVDDFDVGEGNVASFEEQVGGDDSDIDTEPGTEEFQRPRRCKEGEAENKGLLNWEPFWVATL
ncbi:hypothetical protein NC651_020805 [Populus alba x Populus x berolinensis]|nr:hypothetical protein NC651_020805 [Populus alba x Populus x berolinensis]